MADAQGIADKIRTGDTEGLKSAVSEAADQAKRKAQDFGNAAKQSIDQSRGSAADAMDSTADKLGQANTGPTGKMAEGLHSAASYVRQNDIASMMSDLGTAIKNNPTPSLIAAAALGFILGSALRRD